MKKSKNRAIPTCECRSINDWGGRLITTGGVNNGSLAKRNIRMKFMILANLETILNSKSILFTTCMEV